MPVILSSSLPWAFALSVRGTPIQTNSDVTCSRSCNQGKISKKDWKIVRVEKNPFLKKNNPPGFFKSVCLMKQVFVFSLKKHENPIMNCFHCIMQYRHLQNYTIITCYSYYGILIWGSRNVPNLWFCKVLLVNLLQSDKAGQECAQQTEKSYSHTKSAVSRQIYVHALLVQHLFSVFFQYIVWHGPTSETASMQRRQINWLKYTDFTELKKIISRFHLNCSNYSFLFF